MRWYRLCFVVAVLLVCTAIVVAFVCLRDYRQTVREVSAMTEIQTEFSVSNLQDGSLRIEGATNYVTFEKLEKLAIQAKRAWFNHRRVLQEDSNTYEKSLMVYLELPDSAMPYAGRIDIAPERVLGHHFWQLRTFDVYLPAGKIVMRWEPKADKMGLFNGIYFPVILLGLGTLLLTLGLSRKKRHVA